MARDANRETVLYLAGSSLSRCPSILGWLVENGADVPAEGGKAIMLVLQCDLDYQ